MPVSLQARIVFPVSGPPIERGVVTIDGDRISSVGSKTPGQAVRDLGDVALVPGFVNAHTHLEFSHLSRPLGQPGMSLPDWIRLVIAERSRGDLRPGDSIRAGIDESLAAGVTTIGEIATAAWDCYVTTTAPRLTLLLEVIGFSNARVVSAMTAAEERLEAAGQLNDQRFGLSPHAPYTVSPELLRRLVDLAHASDLPVAMHLAESAEELQLLSEGQGPFQELLNERSMWDVKAIAPGQRPLDYLRKLSEAPRSLVIHGNYLTHDEHTFLAEHSEYMSVVYCPRTHDFFGHPPYLLAEMLAAGVHVALGTDSRASNPNLSLLAEMRHVLRTHPSLAPTRVLQLGTFDGAKSLGWESHVGSLSTGKAADLVALPLPVAASGTADELLAAAFDFADRPSAVWLRGQEIELSGKRTGR